jgi:pyruvate/2-oxoglutarate/acetoin dehydrogenase E1 component
VVAEDSFHYLDAPVRRLASPSIPIPFNHHLMHAVVPDVARIADAMQEMVAF